MEPMDFLSYLFLLFYFSSRENMPLCDHHYVKQVLIQKVAAFKCSSITYQFSLEVVFMYISVEGGLFCETFLLSAAMTKFLFLSIFNK